MSARWNNEWDAWAKQGVDLNCRGTVIEELATMRTKLSRVQAALDRREARWGWPGVDNDCCVAVRAAMAPEPKASEAK